MTINANTKLKEIISEFRTDFRVTADKSRNERMETMRPGEPIPDRGKVYSPELRQAFSDRAIDYKNRADEILDDHLKEVHERMTEAPSTAATNTITLLSSRDNVNENDLNHLLEQYGSNYQVHRSLQDIAKKHGIIVPDHLLTKQEQALSDLKSNLDHALTLDAAEKGSEGFYAFLGTQVDQVVSD